jgi:hypothetical protein
MNNIFLDTPTALHRLSICEVCEYNKLGLCLQCGCIIKAKIYLKSSECPVKKWKKQND